MNHYAKALLIALLLSLPFGVGCSKDPEQKTQTSNPAITVDRLFTHEGCTVYRFVDGGRYRYYVSCSSGDHRTDGGYVQNNGKSSYYVEEGIPTSQR